MKVKKPDPVHKGKTWRDMPGNDSLDKRLCFSQWRLGILSDEYVSTNQAQRRKLNMVRTKKGQRGI